MASKVIERGLGLHLRRWHTALASGARRLGFKVAFNAQGIQQKLGLPYSLVAGLTAATLHDREKPHSLKDATRPALEAEVAVWLGKSIDPDSSEAAIADCVRAWAPAIEIVDFDRGFDDVATILEEGVFHRAVVLGEPVAPSRGAKLEGHSVRVEYGSSMVCEVDACQATGHVPAVLRHLARLLAPYDEALRKDDVVILGSMNPLTTAAPGNVFAVSIAGIGNIEVMLTN